MGFIDVTSAGKIITLYANDNITCQGVDIYADNWRMNTKGFQKVKLYLTGVEFPPGSNVMDFRKEEIQKLYNEILEFGTITSADGKVKESYS